MLILSLVAVFFGGYYFYFVPFNKQDVHKQGFYILANISKIAKEKNTYTEKLLGNLIDENIESKKSDSVLRHTLAVKTSSTLLGEIKSDTTKSKKPYVKAVFAKTAPGFLYYHFTDSIENKAQIKLPADSFFKPITGYQKTEIFTGYILISKDNGVIYTDGKLPLDAGASPDSLLKKISHDAFPGIVDIKMENEDYKMFVRPFSISKEKMYICGLLKSSSYNTRLSQIPVGFIYPIVIALLMIVVLLPLIKFYAMGRNEQVNYSDFVLGTISFFAGAAALSIIIIQVLLVVSASYRAEANLKTISTELSNNFINETTSAWEELGGIDKFISNKNDTNVNVSAGIQEYFDNHPRKKDSYYYFDRVSWVDPFGQQKKKGDREDSSNVLVNVTDRKYFTMLANGGGYPVPGHPGEKFGMEAVKSLSNGSYTIVISRLGQLTNTNNNAKKDSGQYTVTMATQMPSITNAVLPPGFGFCIIDENGEAIVHSEMERSLQENFIEKTSAPTFFWEAIASRQNNSAYEILFYGKRNAVHIAPLSNLPFYLVTFYDRGYIMPVNLRILSFSVVFFFICFAGCYAGWYIVFRKKYPANKLLYGPMQHLHWVVPKKQDRAFYRISSCFLILYAMVQVLVLVAINFAAISNLTVLLLAMLLPFNIFLGLVIINERIKKDTPAAKHLHREGGNIRLRNALLLQIGAAVLLPVPFIAKNCDVHIGSYMIVLAVMYIMYCLVYALPLKHNWAAKALPDFIDKIDRAFSLKFKSGVVFENYMVYYARFVTWLVVCLAVLPASVLTWYAHNQEIYQSAKKKQLYLASTLAKQAPAKLQFYKARLPKEAGGNIEKLLYQKGVYSFNNDTAILVPAESPFITKNKIYDQFYFKIAKRIGSRYYDPLRIPALQDSGGNGEWKLNTDLQPVQLKFRYTAVSLTGPGLTKPVKDSLSNSAASKDSGNANAYVKMDSTTKKENKDSIARASDGINSTIALKKTYELEITSHLDKRYQFIGRSAKDFVLIALVILVVFGLYLAIKQLSYNIFLRKFIDGGKGSFEEAFKNILAQYDKYDKTQWVNRRINSQSVPGRHEIEALKEEQEKYPIAKSDTEILKQEKQMAETIERLAGFYSFLWGQCTDNEKYLLLNYAHEGFANFKNTVVMVHLMRMGILVAKDDEIKFFSNSFRAYVIMQKNNTDIQEMTKQFSEASVWQTAKTILLVLVLGIALFIFLTQEQTFQKLLALLGGIGTILTFMLRFFTDGGSLVSGKK